MKSSTKLIILLSLTILIFLGNTTVVFSQKNTDQKQELKTPPKFLKFNESDRVSLQNSTQLFKDIFDSSEKTSFIPINQEEDKLGYIHSKNQQYYNNIKVEFGTVTLHSINGMVASISSEFYKIVDLSTEPTISNTQAFNKAVSHTGAKTYLWEEEDESNEIGYSKPEGELLIVPVFEGRTAVMKLAYKFDIYATDPIYRADVYIDAQTGAFILENKKIHHNDIPASGASLYNGNVSFTADDTSGTYRLRQTADGNGIETYDMNNGTSYSNASDITSGSSVFNDPTGVQAHYGAEQTHKYFSGNHGRNSYDNTGTTIKSYVSYRSNYVNAFWNGSVMTYGDGDGVNYGPLVSVDIVGHEITHGVTEYAANLVYSYESGALNESFSDIFGEAIEQYATGSNDWLMGDQIGAGGSGGALRSMSDPNAKGDPDTYLGDNWYSGSGDNGGVHYNSGVQNFWFYLLTEGGNGTNDNGDSYTVSSIGMDKAGAIAYRNLSVYLGANSQYIDARTGAIQAAIDLYGADSAEEIATTNAWYAVGVGGAYGAPAEYCNSASTNINDEYISRVQLGTIDNSSGAQFYSDFTNQSTNLMEGQSYTITVTPTWTGQSFSEGYAVWIDYNDDQDFNDAGELVWSKAASTNTPNSGTFTVPSETAGTAVRIRVSMKYNGIPTACETFDFGEVEDYTVNLGGSVIDTEAPSAPTNLTASNITQTTVDLSWDASNDNVAVTSYDVYQGANLLENVTGTSIQVTGLTAETAYSFTVYARDGATNTSDASNTENVTTLSSGGGDSTVLNEGFFESGWDGWVDGGSDAYRYSGSRAYEGSYAIRLRDNTNSSVMTLSNINVSSYNNINIEFYFYARSMENGEDFWVQYYDGSSWNTIATYTSGTDFSNNDFYNASVNISSADYNFPSNSQFRFRCDASGNNDQIYIDQVTITGNSGFSPLTTYINSLGRDINNILGNEGNEIDYESDFLLYPNPAKSNISIKLTTESNYITYHIFNMIGKEVLSGVLENETIKVDSLQAGIYFMKIDDGEEQMIQRFIKE
ncbi:MAG: M4 family metallopeptidase [Flavobacteriaceae bacterium]|nr:M4 family metallopeptidase [Flavobacteriaceae bacterium]